MHTGGLFHKIDMSQLQTQHKRIIVPVKVAERF